MSGNELLYSAEEYERSGAEAPGTVGCIHDSRTFTFIMKEGQSQSGGDLGLVEEMTVMRSCSCVDRSDRWPFGALARDKGHVFRRDWEISLVIERGT